MICLMKSQRTRLLLVVLWVFIATFSLVLVFAAELNIKSDLSNAVQHIEKVIFRQNINSDDSSRVILTNEWTFARIETTGYNFMINNSNTNPNKITEASDVVWNTILWWEWNRILDASEYNVIIAWERNKIKGSSWSTIWWGINNRIESGSYNTIAWWSGNKIEWNRSSIAWWENNSISWDYSVAMWFSNNVIGNASVALGNNSNVNANNSFLWTDDVNNGWLNRDNTFAVVSERWMVVNSNKAHSLAKLRIWWSWSLVLSEWSDVDCNTTTKWVIKAENNGGSVCLCSCNWTWWSSLYGGSTCWEVCGWDWSSSPQCGDVKKVCWGDSYTYSWSCVEWKVIEWTWAYFVDKDGRVHRSCQTEDWKVVECKKEPIGDNCDGRWAQNHCDFSLIWASDSLIDRTCNTDWFTNDIIVWRLFDSDHLDVACSAGELCTKVCIEWYVPVNHDWMRYCDPKWCEAKEISGYNFPGVPSGSDADAVKTWTTQDGSYSCTGVANCQLWEFQVPLMSDACQYKCNSWTYLDGYTILNDFNWWVVLHDVKRTYTWVDSYQYECKADIICNNGIVEYTNYNPMTGPEVCYRKMEMGNSCWPTNVSWYSIGVVSDGSGGQAFKTVDWLDWSCSIPYSCNNGVLSFGTESCTFSCGIWDKKSDLGRFWNPYFYSVNYTPKAWKHVNKTELNSCEYTCESGQQWSESRWCYVPGCTCNSLPAHATLSSVTPTYDMTCTYDTNNNKACTFKCNDTYSWNSSTNKCVKCTGSIPSSANENAPGVLPSDVTEYHYSEDTNEACSYSCKNNYTWNESEGKCVENKCTWSYPTCPWVIIWDSNGSTGWHYVNKNNNLAACEWTCDAAYYDYDEDDDVKPCKPKSTTTQCSSVAYMCEDDVHIFTWTDINCSDHKCTWKCDWFLCPAVCEDGYILNEDWECDEEEIIEICRNVVIESNDRYGELSLMQHWYWSDPRPSPWAFCYYWWVLHSLKFVNTSWFETEIMQPVYSYQTSLKSNNHGGEMCRQDRATQVGEDTFNLNDYLFEDSEITFSNYNYSIDYPKTDYWYRLSLHDIFLPEPSEIIINGSYDFKDTCSWTYRYRNNMYQDWQFKTYSCSWNLPKWALLNDNSVVPLNNEEYVCDVFGTWACAYHCPYWFICNEDKNGCEPFLGENWCSDSIFMCSDWRYWKYYDRRWDTYVRIDGSLDHNYLSNHFTSWICEEIDDNDLSTCLTYFNSGEDGPDWCLRYRPCAATGDIPDWCWKYTECYMARNWINGQCVQGYIGWGIITDVSYCSNVANWAGWYIDQNGEDEDGYPCNRCMAKTTCPNWWSLRRSSVDCHGEIVGYVWDKACKKCSLNPSWDRFSFTFDILFDDPEYRACLARWWAIQSCKQLFCKKNWERFYFGLDYNDYVWNCNFNPTQNNCKCKRVGSL